MQRNNRPHIVMPNHCDTFNSKQQHYSHDSKTTEDDGDGGGAAVSTLRSVNSCISGVYSFHNEAPRDALSHEDITPRYLIFVKVAERNLVDKYQLQIKFFYHKLIQNYHLKQ